MSSSTPPDAPPSSPDPQGQLATDRTVPADRPVPARARPALFGSALQLTGSSLEPNLWTAGSLIHSRYRLERLVGEGGGGRTFLAQDLVQQQTVALKALSQDDHSRRQALRQEFALLRGLFHPQLQKVHDLGFVAMGTSVQPFYVSDYIEGTPLGSFCQTATPDACLAALVDALRALAFVHAVHLVHGDFKPDNVLVDGQGRGTLIDFGCARQAGYAQPTLSGTPGFMAPETVRGEPVDARADLYAVGKTIERIFPHGVPSRLERLVARLTAQELSKRPVDVREVLETLGDSTLPSLSHPGAAGRFIGRTREMHVFGEALERTLLGRSGARALWVWGLEGSGKSRLQLEMKWRAQERCTALDVSGHRPGAMDSLLQRAHQGPPLQPGIDGVLQLVDEVCARGTPCVLVVDDADRLQEQESEQLHALIRYLPQAGPLLVVCAAQHAPPDDIAATQLHLAPLQADAIADWVLPFVAKEQLEEIVSASGGLPSEIEWCIRKAQGSEKGQTSSEAQPSRGRTTWLGRCTATGWSAAAIFAINDGSLDLSVSPRVVSDEALAELVANGGVRREQSTFRLSRPSELLALKEELGAERLARAHLSFVNQIRDDPPSGLSNASKSALLVRHAMGANQLHLAAKALSEGHAQLTDDGANERAEDRATWSRVAVELVDAFVVDPLPLSRAWSDTGLSANGSSLAGLTLLLLDVAQAVGRPDIGLRAAACAFRHEPFLRDVQELAAQVAQCCLALGQHQRASRYLDRALAATGDPGQRTSLLLRKARSLLLTGHHVEANQLARSLEVTPDSKDQLLQAELLALTEAYVGRTDSARRHFATAASLRRSPREEIRFVSYQAINEFRAGQLEAALPLYGRALDIAEQHHLTDLTASAALNWATACQQAGEWGQALSNYEKALRVARVLGKHSTVATLEFNLANLFQAIGCFDRATQVLDRSSDELPQELRHLALSRAVLRAEISLVLEHFEWTAPLLEKAEELAGEQDAHREQAEIALHWAELETKRGALDDAAVRLQAGRTLIQKTGARDLWWRLLAGEARLEIARRRPHIAMGLLEESLAAEGSHPRPLRAELRSVLAEASNAAGFAARAETEQAAARELWQGISDGLPDFYRDSFWAHPLRRQLPTQEGSARWSGRPSPAALESARQAAAPLPARLTHFLAINQRLNSALSVQDVLIRTMDAAIELTGAERGFVLITEDDRLQVAVARNMEGDEATSDLHTFSRSIAERVLATREAILTLDASLDQRFAGQKSVHAMRLKSVACVPISSPDGVLGALYLDNRFRPSGFGEADGELLSAFADQAAIALRNARLVAALESRTRELEEEKGRVERLSAGQALEIKRLAKEVENRQRALETRYDYSSIVGQSSQLKAVFSVLDRVIATDVNVLIQGESGTGKELVARAIHYNGVRKRSPFVGINCAALPENLLEVELFGAVRGAFTGAERNRTGLLVEAGDGTVFLDEIGDLPLGLQAKLLRVLQEREVRPIGATAAVKLRARFVFATHRTLRDEVASGKFREDLFFRIGVVDVTIPPLRERPEDIALIAEVILQRLAKKLNRPAPRLSVGASSALTRHRWPGNVRELENVLTKAFVLNEDAQLTEDALDLGIPLHAKTAGTISRNRQEFEKEEERRLLDALTAHAWNVSEAARSLSMPRNTFYRKLKRFGLQRRDGG